MSAANKEFIRRYLAAMGESKSPENVDIYISDEDRELKEHIAFFEAVLPGYQIAVEDLVAEGDKVTVRGRVTGTHKGELMGIPPSGKDVDFDLMLIYRIEGEQIVEHWMVADQLTMMKQIGAIPG